MSSIERFRIQKQLEQLRNFHGRGTELITLYIKPFKQTTEVTGKLRHERETSSNIKSDKTRNNVQDALTKIIQKLKLNPIVGKNGLVVFCGNIDSIGWILELVEPIHPCPINLYQCDDHFHVEYLLEMFEPKETYGLILIDSKKSCIALLRGNNLEILESTTSGVEGKHSKGGQSQRRFERQREERLKIFFKRIAEHTNNFYLPLKNLKGIIIGGCGFTKEEWVKGKYIDYRLQSKILKEISVGYSGEQGLKELIYKMKDFLKNVRYVEEMEIVNSFLEEIGKDSGMGIYGETEVITALEEGRLRLLILSESLPYSKIDMMSKIAITQGTAIEMISSSHEAGDQLVKSFNGIAGIVYY